jgi:hypothetical protein
MRTVRVDSACHYGDVRDKRRRGQPLRSASERMTAAQEWDPSEPWQVQQVGRISRGLARSRLGRVALVMALVGLIATIVGPVILLLTR